MARLKIQVKNLARSENTTWGSETVRGITWQTELNAHNEQETTDLGRKVEYEKADVGSHRQGYNLAKNQWL